MRRLAVAILFTALTSVAQSTPLHSDLQSQVPASNPTAISSLVIPAGTTVSLALTNPIMSKTAKAGDSVYAETAFPVAVKNQMAIPAWHVRAGSDRHAAAARLAFTPCPVSDAFYENHFRQRLYGRAWRHPACTVGSHRPERHSLRPTM